MKTWIARSTYANLIALMMLMPLQLAASDTMDELNEARMEGQISMAYALNEHLSVFDLDVEVNGSEAIISGRVEEDVQKDLAEEVARSLDGIDSVENRIDLSEASAEGGHDDGERGYREVVSDATTTATVKSKLLWNRNTSGLDIDVSTENGVVSLEGDADSEAGKELAERLAANTDGVHTVENRIRVTGASDSDDEESRGIGDVVSDSWITTKVRSTLIFTRNVPARSIGIDTKDGVVALEGEVDNSAARGLAIELASDIRGVRKVDAENLRVDQD